MKLDELSRRDALRIAIALVPLAPSLALGQSTPDPAASCIRHLTFRWTSGEPIRLNVRHPAGGSLQNAPFLIDPEILSVTVGRDWLGPRLLINFGAAPAAVLASESSTHVGRQMLIMLGDSVITAAIVRGPFRDAMVLSGLERYENLSDLADALRGGPSDSARCAVS